MEKLIRFCDRISGVGGIISGIMICSGTTLIIAEILMRSIFNKTLYITEEYTGYLMAALTFLSLSYTQRDKEHIRMTLLYAALKPKQKAFLDMACYAVGLIFALLLTGATFRLFLDSLAGGSMSMQVSKTPLAIPQAFLPLGGAILAVQFIAELLKTTQVLQISKEATIPRESPKLGH